MNRKVSVIRRGQFPDSSADNLSYWLSRPSGERIAAVEELRRTTYSLIHGSAFPRMLKIAKVLKRGDE